MLALERREAALLALIAIEGPTARSKAAALLWAEADTDKHAAACASVSFSCDDARNRCDSRGEILALATRSNTT